MVILSFCFCVSGDGDVPLSRNDESDSRFAPSVGAAGAAGDRAHHDHDHHRRHERVEPLLEQTARHLAQRLVDVSLVLNTNTARPTQLHMHGSGTKAGLALGSGANVHCATTCVGATSLATTGTANGDVTTLGPEYTTGLPDMTDPDSSGIPHAEGEFAIDGAFRSEEHTSELQSP